MAHLRRLSETRFVRCADRLMHQTPLRRHISIASSESMQELFNSLQSTFGNMHQFCQYDCKMEQLQRLAQALHKQNATEEEDACMLHQRYDDLQTQLSNWKEMEQNFTEYWEFYQLSLEENDESLQKDCVKQLQQIEDNIHDLYHALLLNGEDDHNGCYLQVSAGSGGLEAQDWAQTLFDMYLAWCKRHSYEHKVLFTKKADVGINQAAVEISERNMYGWLRHEQGVHRRSRVSPYGQTANSKRQTSFASVQVTAMNDAVLTSSSSSNALHGDIPEKDLEWVAFNGSGPGGQHRNTTDTAVRCTHKPTGITVVVQDERNQYNSKVAAIRHLKFKLKRLEEDKMKKLKREKYETFGEQTFGNQIRNYIYTPYQMIKDTRTKCELKNQAFKDALQNGNIDLLLQKSLETFNTTSSLLQ